MKYRLFLLLSLIIMQTAAFASTWLDSGKYDIKWYNTSKTEFEISTPQQLAGVAYLVNNKYTDFDGKTLILSNDIDLSGSEWVGIGTESYGFMGVFDGNNHQIKHLTMYSYSGKYPLIGFFNNAYCSIIKNLSLSGDIYLSYTTGAYPETIVGALAGKIRSTQIENIKSSVEVTYNRNDDLNSEYYIAIGGLVGNASEKSSFKNSYCDGNITLKFMKDEKGYYKKCTIYVGGIIGYAQDSNISRCGRPKGSLYLNGGSSYNTDTIYTSVGGLIGSSCDNNLKYLYNNSEIFEIYIGSNSGLKFGGIAGYLSNYSHNGVINCYSSTNNFHIAANGWQLIQYGGISPTYTYYNDLLANYSPSDMNISCNWSLNISNVYSGSIAFSQQQMQSDEFLEELNLYPNINGDGDIWERKEDGFPYLRDSDNNGIIGIEKGNNTVAFNVRDNSISFTESVHIELYSINGELLYSDYTNITPEFTDGLYIMRLTKDGLSKCYKILIR